MRHTSVLLRSDTKNKGTQGRQTMQNIFAKWNHLVYYKRILLFVRELNSQILIWKCGIVSSKPHISSSETKKTDAVFPNQKDLLINSRRTRKGSKNNKGLKVAAENHSDPAPRIWITRGRSEIPGIIFHSRKKRNPAIARLSEMV